MLWLIRFPLTAHPDVIYSSYTADLLKKKKKRKLELCIHLATFEQFRVRFQVVEH